jgi:DNA-directed RNA polymerase I subunit RPA34
MAKKIISEEVIIDSDAGLTTDSEVERDLEEKAVEFIAPKKYTKKIDNKKPKILENLGKKEQIWLIKLPKDVDISSITKIPIGSSSSNNNNNSSSSEFEINGKYYNIIEDDSKTNSKLGKNGNGKFQIFLPNEKNNNTKFNSSKNDNEINITKFLDIVEKVKIPEINYNKVVIQRTNVEKQENLRMRHFPTGYYIKDYEEAKEPVIPGSKNNNNKDIKQKRKHDHLNNDNDNDDDHHDDDDDDELDHKKHKKEKKEKKDKKEKKEKKDKKKSKKIHV